MSATTTHRLGALAAAVVTLAAVCGSVPVGAEAATNNVYTVAGDGHSGFSGDGGLATSAELSSPAGVTATADGGFLIADQANNRIRRVGPDGGITTVAGDGAAGFSGDGGPATTAHLNAPSGVAIAPDGSLLIADSSNNRVRRVAPNGTISTVAGTGTPGFSGDGFPAVDAKLSFPVDVAVAADGSFYIADNDNNRIRGVSPGGIITTYAGTGTPGFGGDGGLATAAQLNDPAGVALTQDGGFLIADMLNHRVRRIAPDGTITTVAGNGTAGSGGDNGDATSAQLNQPARVAVEPNGAFVIADKFNHRVRRVAASGRISTVAGTGVPGGGGEGIPATAAPLNTPLGVAVDAGGDYLVADTGNHIIRRVDDGDPPSAPAPPAPAPTPPRPLVARLSVSPEPTCTGVSTRLDGSASSGPAPIVRYRFEYTQHLQRGSNENFYSTEVPSDGSVSVASTTFTWNRVVLFLSQHSNGGEAPWRDDLLMTLTVEDVNGRQAQTQALVTFAQHSTLDSRKSCPFGLVTMSNRPLTVGPSVFRAVKVTSSTWSVPVPCRAQYSCVGSVTGLVATSRARLASAAATRRRGVVVFRGPIAIPAGKTTVIRGKLTAAGRRLLKRRRGTNVTVAFTLFRPDGKRVTTSRMVRLR